MRAHTVGALAEETADLDIADIARLVRADVKAARATGMIPADVKVSVRIDRYSMGQAIYVRATLPDRPARVTADDPRSVVHDRRDEYANTFAYTVEASNLSDTLRAIVNAYNWDDSDSQTDYFNSRFSASVTIEGNE